MMSLVFIQCLDADTSYEQILQWVLFRISFLALFDKNDILTKWYFCFSYPAKSFEINITLKLRLR